MARQQAHLKRSAVVNVSGFIFESTNKIIKKLRKKKRGVWRERGMGIRFVESRNHAHEVQTLLRERSSLVEAHVVDFSSHINPDNI